ncbi:hypothetical protein SDC9_102273 [bioreactor metagenome]|uniref:Uncharacterized protein n=1 Tax=bioreactor metagenome TaxID=1076179 RepID=A0A645ARD6_9ZZZZ
MIKSITEGCLREIEFDAITCRKFEYAKSCLFGAIQYKSLTSAISFNRKSRIATTLESSYSFSHHQLLEIVLITYMKGISK